MKVKKSKLDGCWDRIFLVETPRILLLLPPFLGFKLLQTWNFVNNNKNRIKSDKTEFLLVRSPNS